MLLSVLLPAITMLPLEMLLQELLANHLNLSYCVTFVVEENINFQNSVNFMYIVTNGSNTKDLMYKIFEVSEKGCSDFVVKIKKPSIFVEAFDKANNLQNIRRGDKKVIMLPFEDKQSSVENLFDVLAMKEITFLANLLLVLPVTNASSDCMSYYLFTHKFVGTAKDVGQPKYLDTWNSCTSKFAIGADIFPHNIKNLEGKTLKVACFSYEPYTLLDLDTNIAPYGRDGIEMRIVEEFCRWVNCTMELVRCDEGQWGEIYKNKTGSGVLGSLVEDRADVGIGGLYSWYEEFIWLDFSASTVRCLVTCIAPSPRLLVSWEMPLLPFRWDIWIGIVVMVLLCALALCYVQRSSDKAFLIAFGVLTGQPCRDAQTSWRKRSVTGWIIVSGLILGSAYGAGLATTFTVPKYEPPIDTLQDLIDRKMEWGATHEAWVYALTITDEPIIKQIVNQFRVLSSEELKLKTFSRSMAFSVEELPESFAISDYITKEAVKGLRLMKESLYYGQCVLMLRKSSPYTQKLDEMIGLLHQTGLMLAFEKQVAIKHLDRELQLGVKNSVSKRDVKIETLSLNHIVGIFYFYIIGIFFSVILFAMEVILKNKYLDKYMIH